MIYASFVESWKWMGSLKVVLLLGHYLDGVSSRRSEIILLTFVQERAVINNKYISTIFLGYESDFRILEYQIAF